jgi:hypothetical protein
MRFQGCEADPLDRRKVVEHITIISGRSI